MLVYASLVIASLFNDNALLTDANALPPPFLSCRVNSFDQAMALQGLSALVRYRFTHFVCEVQYSFD